ncbi:hypothetical protein LCGC14_1342180 [marine sediment metagenome]|uniref:Uncharacterized protein n=1 Tax=marine sediment metagenome TaxID=412755 RepID=A0A0F9KD63_9ZZZZ
MFKKLLDRILNFDYPWNSKMEDVGPQLYIICQHCDLPICDNLAFARRQAVCTCIKPVEGIIKING